MEVQIVDYNLACVYAYIKGVNDLEHLLNINEWVGQDTYVTCLLLPVS